MSCRTGPLRAERALTRLFTGFAFPQRFVILSEVEGPAFGSMCPKRIHVARIVRVRLQSCRKLTTLDSFGRAWLKPCRKAASIKRGFSRGGAVGTRVSSRPSRGPREAVKRRANAHPARSGLVQQDRLSSLLWRDCLSAVALRRCVLTETPAQVAAARPERSARRRLRPGRPPQCRCRRAGVPAGGWVAA